MNKNIHIITIFILFILFLIYSININIYILEMNIDADDYINIHNIRIYIIRILI